MARGVDCPSEWAVAAECNSTMCQGPGEVARRGVGPARSPSAGFVGACTIGRAARPGGDGRQVCAVERPVGGLVCIM